jgi:hypothetical protein
MSVRISFLMPVLVVGSLITQDAKVHAFNSPVNANGGASQMPDEKCRRESAQNNDADRAARYDQCMARKSKNRK